MPTSPNRHPSRDALLRDSLGQLREQRGITLDSFAHELNEQAHLLCPIKMEGQARMSSFTGMTREAFRAVDAWRKKVERWSMGETEIPAWLEEPWVAALDALGDGGATRLALVNRHGLIGIKLPMPSDNNSSSHEFVGDIAQSLGSMMTILAQMLEDGILDENDETLAKALMPVINKSLSDILTSQMIVRREVFGETVQ